MNTPPIKKTSSKTRDLILKQAVQLFNDRGFHDTRLEDIANELGKAKTSISYHFQSKETLYKEAFEISCAFNECELNEAEKQSTGLDRILWLVRQRADLHTRALAGKIQPIMVLSDIEVVTDMQHPGLGRLYEKQVLRLTAFIEGGNIDGSISVSSPEASTFFLLNILHWLPGWLSNIPNARHMSAIDGLCDVLRNGIAQNPNRVLGRSILRPQSEDYPAIFDRKVRNQLKRDAFLRTGTRFLNQRGFRNLSLNDISNELGVTRGAFYYYIADKDALIENCFDRSCDTIEKALQSAIRNSHHDTLEIIEQTISILFEGHITDHNPLLRMSLLSAVRPLKRVAIEARLKQIRASISEITAKAMMDGSARNLDLDSLENLLMGSIFGASQWRLAATPLKASWKPALEPIGASACYFEPLLAGFARK